MQQVLQTNQDLCSRLGSLEFLPSNRSIRSTATKNGSDDEDDVSTIRPKRLASDLIPGSSETRGTGVRRFTFENDLGQSKVYKRVKWRNSLGSLTSSDALSFGWSCLSDLSLADVSNISVVSLPIASNDLSNGQHYKTPSVERDVLWSLERVFCANPASTTQEIHRKGFIEPATYPNHLPTKKIAILGKQALSVSSLTDTTPASKSVTVV